MVVQVPRHEYDGEPMQTTTRALWFCLLLAGCIEEEGAAGDEPADAATPAGSDAAAPDSTGSPGPDRGNLSDAITPPPTDARPLPDASLTDLAPRPDAVRPTDGPPPGPDCPIPRVARDSFSEESGRVVLLDARRSEAGPGGTPGTLTYRWDVVEAPEGSTSRPVERLGPDAQAPLVGAVEDDPSTPEVRLFLDAVGTYTVDLTVTRDDGATAPSPACPAPAPRVTIEARPNGGLRVEMTWHTPGDADESDGQGADLDLHLLHPTGERWGDRTLDCHYRNPAPDWGRAGDPLDDPTLDLDDLDGGGPEVVTLDAPEDTDALGGAYRVGVEYYRAHDLTTDMELGPSFVSLRVFLNGDLAWTNEAPMELPVAHAFWEAVEILWAPEEHRVRVVDSLTFP